MYFLLNTDLGRGESRKPRPLLWTSPAWSRLPTCSAEPEFTEEGKKYPHLAAGNRRRSNRNDRRRTHLYVGLSKVAVQLDLLRDVHRFRSYKLQQGNGDTRVPGGDSGLGLCQIPPAALQVGGWRAVQGHAGQLVVEPAVVFGLDLITLDFGHQTLRDQLV